MRRLFLSYRQPTVLDGLLRELKPHRMRPRSRGRRLVDLLRVCDLVAPELLGRDHALLWALAEHEWLRPPDRWTGGDGRSLVEHLLVRVRFELPGWLWGEVLAADPRGRGLELSLGLLVHVGGGGDLRHAGAGGLPDCLTRKMRSLTWSSSEPTLVRALRRAQITALGGPEQLMAITQVRRYSSVRRTYTERRLQRVLAWLCARRVALPPAQLEALVRWLLWLRELPRTSLANTLRAMEEAGRPRPRNRIGPLPEWSVPPFVEVFGGAAWSVMQVRSGSELFHEGRELRHCVASYERRARSGHCALLSVRRDGERTLTLELTGAGVIQARGLRNRLPSEEEQQVLRRWATHAGVELVRFTG